MKRKEIKRTPLAETVLRSLEPEDKLYRIKDGPNQLHFTVAANGSKRWEVRFKRPDGKWSWLGVGGYPAVSAKFARKQADLIQAQVSDGKDPREVRRAEEAAKKALIEHPFSESCEYWYNKKLDDGYAKSTAKQMRGYLDNDILPELGNIPIKQITPKQCADLQHKIELSQSFDKSKKVRQALNQIFRYAIGRGICETNPASELRYIAKRRGGKTPFPHLLEPELPDFLRAVESSTSRTQTVIAMKMTLFTASRPGMVVKAEWTHVNLDLALWVVPEGNMKNRTQHIVPLPVQLVALLKKLKEMTGRSRYLFPSIGPKNPTMPTDSINKMLRGIGYKGRLTGHGSRHTASTLLHEHGWHHYHIEAQLSHKMPGVAGVYNQAAYLEARRVMMQWYADYLDALRKGLTEKQKKKFEQRVVEAMIRYRPVEPGQQVAA
ncbi:MULTISPECIES: tyrosine-type recombinase/integrase [Marinobacter]|uniref:Tyrosine-type recombinase/integrase n=1 Tax=Marinobacter daepoensis TaxID=262077 RepID=A0ABS3BEU2_9GAMM|nr:site-specific integrase [Marinobacter daepoensis]MBN7769840.1 tyrosine-type recombinase/integrase [Marinobacter daepoensis]MBY6080228.1 tyrosine-type recombinase/integrase [Marinobacter daepoensis]|tara:strand:+ start:3220 stop:4524 length:1305 start_codon:yes stop_codon:yes gene_type:complete